MNIYQENGFKDRDEYLRWLSDDNFVPLDVVRALADVLGPDEDFDALVASVEDLDASFY